MSARLTLGPVLYHWPGAERDDFYARIADEAAIDTVYLGEVVCAKRLPIVGEATERAAARLGRAGKAVVASTLALVMDEGDLAALAEVADGEGLVEANDVAALARLAGRPHVVGPFVNAYNEATLAWLAANGASRVVLPAELAATAIATLAAAAPVEIEVQVFGRLPLALSARCYHARAHGLAKDGCRFVCGENREGLVATTLDGTPFVAVNGTQTLSVPLLEASAEIGALAEAGVGWFRLWPQALDMVAVATVYRDLLDRRIEAEAAHSRIAAIAGDRPLGRGLAFGHEGRSEGWLARAE